MASGKHGSMRSYTLALTALLGFCLLQAQIAPAQATKPQKSASTQRNPFESVPQPPQSAPPKIAGPTIGTIEFRGASRVSQSSLRAVIESRVGNAYDRETLRRDAQALYNTGRFSDIRWESETGPAGAIVRFVVVERPLIQSIEYQGGGTVTISEVLERLKQRKVKLGVETLYIEDQLGRAAVTVQELVAEKGTPEHHGRPTRGAGWAVNGEDYLQG